MEAGVVNRVTALRAGQPKESRFGSRQLREMFLFSSELTGSGTHLAGGKQNATCLLAGLLNYSSPLKMEAIRSSETSGTTLRTTRGHIPEDDTLQMYSCILNSLGAICKICT
jgi:hypothetical protein